MHRGQTEQRFNMAIPSLPSPSLPSISAPPLPAAPKVKAPKLPAPTKINIKTGTGAPGGFSGAATKKPGQEMAKLSAAAGTVSGQITQVAALATNPLAAAALAPIKAKLSSLAAGYKKKAADAGKSAVDFVRPAKIPKLPAKPNIDIPKLDLPKLPAVPSIPSVPSVLSGLNAPSLPSAPNLPSIPSAPSVLSGLNAPSLPSAPNLPSIPSLPKV